jgi:hypothetical protein
MTPGETALEAPRTAADLCQPISLSPEARALLTAGQKPVAFLRLLVEHRHYADAIRLLTCGMQPRQAVWWACLCARQAGGDDLPPSERAALGAAVAWVLEPSAANQQAAQAASVAATLQTPAGCAARAAYWAGSTPAPDQPVVPLRPALTAKLAGGCAFLAVARAQPSDMNWTYRQFIALAIDVDCGLNTWREKESEKIS